MNNLIHRPWLLALALSVAAPLAALETGGFLQSRVGLSEGSSPALNTVGLSLNHLRVKLASDDASAVKVVVMPELAGGFSLLDAYADWSPAADGALSLRVGQFKFPFGQDRMPGPQALERADYSAIDAALFPGSAWDVGAAVTLKGAGLRLDAAVIEGQGANLAASGPVGARERSDVSGRLEWSGLDGGLTLGASLYQGLSQKTPWAPTATIPAGDSWGPSHTWSGGHLKAKAGRLSLRAEAISRDDRLWGATVEPRLALTPGLSVVAYYDRVEDQANDAAGKTAVGAALAWQALPQLELTLDLRGSAAGPDQRPTRSQALAQVQAGF
jgi:hypothetical protein